MGLVVKVGTESIERSVKGMTIERFGIRVV